ncbi:MAG: YdeI/OmpD-associated family protein [Clostridiales bacterium]|jgi:uncharacterized protein YdeI (YjbR/CyaY-like superfamily)|nr:YdeI/OmpD-associated family protein [Clostridiales bacterium]
MENFIGTGKNPNPNEPDIPLGLGMELAQNPKAMENFGKMSAERRADIINRVQNAKTGEDAKTNISQVISELSNM